MSLTTVSAHAYSRNSTPSDAATCGYSSAASPITRPLPAPHLTPHDEDLDYEIGDGGRGDDDDGDDDDTLDFGDLQAIKSTADSYDNDNSPTTSSDRPFLDLFPTDIWSIASRRAHLGHRTYHAHAVHGGSIAARTSATHALTTRILSPYFSSTRTTTPTTAAPLLPCIIVVWASASRATAARDAMRAAYGPLLVGTHPRKLITTKPFCRGHKPVAACSPSAVLRMDASRLPADPIIVFAELPDPEAPDNNDDDEDVDSRHHHPQTALGIWSAVAGCAGSAGEASRVFVLLDPDNSRDCAMAPRLRARIRAEGVEVPELVARIAEQGIPDPVDEEMSAEEEEEEEEEEREAGKGTEGGDHVRGRGIGSGRMGGGVRL